MDGEEEGNFMKMKLLLALTGLTLAISGCSSTDSDNSDVVAKNEMHCEYRTKLGTSIKKKVCMTSEQKKQQKIDEQRTKQMLGTVRGAGLQDSGL